MVPRLLALAAPCLLAGALAARPAPDLPLSPQVTRGVAYATADGETLKLDVAAPARGGPYPGVLLLHGGAWVMGGRGDLAGFLPAIAEKGYVVASASYRLAPKHPFPAQLDDARAAVRFLRANAKTYNIDPDKVAVGGFSAGGHLALLLALNPPPTDAGPSSAVTCAVSYFGPTDLSLYAKSPGVEDAYMVPFLGKACKTDPDVYKKASPISFASKAAPPVLMIHGTADFVVPVIHSERLLAKLRTAGATAELLTVPGAGHGWGGKDAERAMATAVRFLDTHLKGAR
ncbi:alpha/beta hydrolase [bacterium]|nr:alpha/beta hydrolase [bacterium]